MKKIAFLIGLLGAPFAHSELLLKDGYIQVPIPGQAVTAAFFTVRNTGPQPCDLLGAETSVADRAELHGHNHREGMVQMRRLPKLAVAAGGVVQLQPGGDHLMLFGVENLGVETEPVAVSLDFGGCGRLPINLPVRDRFRQDHDNHHSEVGH